MGATRTLSEYLKTAGVQVTPTEPAPAPAAAPAAAPAPAKTAAAPAPAKEAGKASQPADKGGVPTPRDNHNQAPKGPTSPKGGGSSSGSGKCAAVTYDPAVITTPEQKWLLEQGIVIPDAKIASIVYGQQVAISNQVKTAELEKLAEEERCKGALQYHGMLKESMAMQYANGTASIHDLCKVAAWIGVPAQEIIKRAETLRAATPSPALVDGHLGSAARPGSSTMAAAEQNGNTTQFEPEGAAGTRQPVSGQDEKLVRFTDTITLPGNPGLNHGQQVDQGKGYSR